MAGLLDLSCGARVAGPGCGPGLQGPGNGPGLRIRLVAFCTRNLMDRLLNFQLCDELLNVMIVLQEQIGR